ncbi:MAG: M14 family metallocarboxypeptidase [Muribaculaceae bacterium]|nr:M14 family metallocarboxypeptidase [Roseburia sp.]MCM1430358.1 M14 family metallocarboxypeptidase [Muribaculaceae bacterium]MCM1492446.1 M14 family metallocarboxypeptidase [Muribaculaceae bacterium]
MADQILDNMSVVPTDKNYSYRLLTLVVEELLAKYPYMEVGTAGRSVMGKDLLYLRLGKGPVEVCYNASFHANESITTPVLLKFAEDLMREYVSGGSVRGVYPRQLFEEFSLYLVPMVNPDGVDLVNGALTEGEYYNTARQIAEAYPGIPFPAGWKANIEGVDLNLQFPAGWEQARSIKFGQGYNRPAPRDYVGLAPLIAPESRAMYDFTVAHDFRLILAYHTQGEVIYWKYLQYEPEDSYRIARYFGEVSGYLVEETPVSSGYAGYKDWFIESYNRPGYTIEAGLGTNLLPMSQFSKIYEENTGILLGGMTELEK